MKSHAEEIEIAYKTAVDEHSECSSLNFIGEIRDHLDRDRNKTQPKSEELWERLKEGWYNVPEYYLEKLEFNLCGMYKKITPNIDLCL